MGMNGRIGFMQGRLSPLVNGFIQAFPWDNWQKEFVLASSLGIDAMEWTLDQERLYENPLLTTAGQKKIGDLCKQHSITIPSISGYDEDSVHEGRNCFRNEKVCEVWRTYPCF